MSCKHLNAQARGQDRIGWMYCPDCKEQIPMNVILRNFLDEFAKLREEILNELGRLRSTIDRK